MANELKAYPVPNLVQGVSQQTPQQRRPEQCEAQFDCVNSPINGAEARPHVQFQKLIAGVDLSGAFCYEIFRGDEEHYVVAVAKEPQGGHRLLAYDLLNGAAPCTITYTASEDYLDTTALPKDKMCGATVNDYTFLANREIAPAMDPTQKSHDPYNEGIIYFKAGGYKIVFQVIITYDDGTGAKVYVFSYETPDNSNVANAPYITTSQLAKTFFRGFTGVDAAVPSSGDVFVGTRLGNENGVGSGASGTTASGGTTLTSLGFYVGINGNCLIIGRSDTKPFKIQTSDGVGDTYLRSIKDNATSFSDLPQKAFQDFTTKVQGTNAQKDDDYWVYYDVETNSWLECPQPGISIKLDPDTMPHALVSTGVGTFEFKQAPWGARVSGDGENSSPDPSFVGSSIRDMFYDSSRLAIMCEGSTVWSRSRNPFVFFPDSAQTTLDTDPVDIEVGGGKTIALLRKGVQQDESVFLWAPKIQFRVSSGTNPFRQDTVEAKPSTRYEFAPQVAPLSVGDSLIFANEPGNWAVIRDLLIQDGKPRGITNISQHVSKYLPSGVRIITASDTLGLIVFQTDAEPTKLWAYNYLVDGQKRLQSAWNIWRMPVDGNIIWCSLTANILHMLVQRDEGVVYLTMDLTVDLTDDDPGAEYLTRLDYRVNEEQVTMAYDSGTNKTTITLPWTPSEFEGWTGDGLAAPIIVVNRQSSADADRGKVWPTVTVSGDTVVVTGDCTAEKLYIGYRIDARRREGTFYLKNQNGLIPTQFLTIVNYVVSYAKTGYFRAEVKLTNRAEPFVNEFPGRRFGDPNNVTDSFPITDGSFTVPVGAPNDEFYVELVNDSFLPSRWTTAQWHYLAAFMATPQQVQTGSGGQGASR